MSSFMRKISKVLFSIKELSDCFEEVSICGFKFKRYNSVKAVRSLRNFLIPDRFVCTMWQTKEVADREDLMRYFEFVSSSPHAWHSYFRPFWLIYVACLIEAGEVQKARIALDTYIAYKGLTGIETCKLVARFAQENGISNEAIEKTIYIHDELSKSHEKEVFYESLKDKTIALVGNAPSEVGKAKGAEIDSHDIVVRFNNYEIKGYENDYGSKTDIWTRAVGSGGIIDRKEKYKLNIWRTDFDHDTVRQEILDILYRQFKNGENVYNFDAECHYSLIKASGIGMATSGLLFIWEYYRKFGNFDNIDFYGFSFCQDEPVVHLTHYFDASDDEELKYCARFHHMNKETEFLRELISNNSKKNRA